MLTLERIDTSVTELWEEMVGGGVGGGWQKEGKPTDFRFQILLLCFTISKNITLTVFKEITLIKRRKEI